MRDEQHEAVDNERGAIRHGYNQGRAEGLAEGLAEGEAKGETKANRNNARRMKADGMSAELIAKYTGLTAEEIEQL